MKDIMVPITIFTGFLGSGKTTVINQIIEQNKDAKFGLIINEFGEIGVDGQIVTSTGDEMIEMSNGCLCCIVRGDLQEAVLKLVKSGKIDYILIEASGLAEPMPIAQTFAVDDLGGKISLDCVIATLDASNYMVSQENYKVAKEQIEFADIILFNKVKECKLGDVELLTKVVYKINPEAKIVLNEDGFDTALLIETNAWNPEKLINFNPTSASNQLHKHDHHGHDHRHEHEHVDEVVFSTEKIFDPVKLDEWMQNRFPKNVIRAKGFLRLPIPLQHNPIGNFLFQMVGSKKQLTPFVSTRKDFNSEKSVLVLIGKHLHKENIFDDLAKCVMD